MTITPSTKPHLRVDHVSYQTSGGALLIDSINFEVQSCDMVALVGPNGAGKTTLLRMMAGLIAPTKGSITLDGLSVETMSFSDRAKQIAYVGQSDNADGRLSVAQYIGLGVLPYHAGSSRDHVSDAINTVGLEQFASKRMDQLSGGEVQKARIARAICQKPKLLVLDEPTNHLDPHARGELLSLVARMGITVVAALHDLTLIESFAPKTAVLEKGKLLSFGQSTEVLSHAQISETFGVSLLRLQHPHENRVIPTLDIQISA